jgi:hypothetical protein
VCLDVSNEPRQGCANWAASDDSNWDANHQ